MQPSSLTAVPTVAVSRGVDAVVVGASAGGIDALLLLLKGLPRAFGPAVVVVLHLPEHHESGLAEIFASRVALPTREAHDKQPVAAGVIHFAPPGYHLSIERDHTFSLSCEAPVNYSRPSIDVLMESAAAAYRDRVAGILLTGANADGAEGLASIHEAGGVTLVQDPEDAEVPTMPLAAIARRRPDAVLALTDIRAWLARLER